MGSDDQGTKSPCFFCDIIIDYTNVAFSLEAVLLLLLLSLSLSLSFEPSLFLFLSSRR